jgi:FAD/FMN-containing dehydrogenase
MSDTLRYRQTPVLLLAFNRPETTSLVFERLREVQPLRLLISLDGPRADVKTDLANCLAVREIVSRVDWDCNVSTRVAKTNRGCRYGPASGIDWAFRQVDEVIILEDDCVPDPSFFLYCAELLDRYRDTPLVRSIGGHRWEAPDLRDGAGYYYSRYPSTWGWATWADRWRGFDVDMQEWRTLRSESWLINLLRDERYVNYWHRTFDAMIQGLDAWDYAWLFACWMKGGLSIRSNVNLVANLGFGSAATHTFQSDHPASRLATNIDLPLRHPPTIEADERVEELLEWANYSGVVTRQVLEGARRIGERRRGNF